MLGTPLRKRQGAFRAKVGQLVHTGHTFVLSSHSAISMTKGLALDRIVLVIASLAGQGLQDRQVALS